MTTAEHLERIKAKCLAIVSDHGDPIMRALAGSTISAIEALQKMPEGYADFTVMSQSIRAAWPEELL